MAEPFGDSGAPKRKQFRKKTRKEPQKRAKGQNPRGMVHQSVTTVRKELQRTADLATRRVHVPVRDRWGWAWRWPWCGISPCGAVCRRSMCCLLCWWRSLDRLVLARPLSFVRSSSTTPRLCGVARGRPPRFSHVRTAKRGQAQRPRHCRRGQGSRVHGPVSLPFFILTAFQNRRITFIEVPNELTAMLDAAKVADLVLLMIDAKFGFEMEQFELLNMLQTHGMPKAR